MSHCHSCSTNNNESRNRVMEYLQTLFTALCLVLLLASFVAKHPSIVYLSVLAGSIFPTMETSRNLIKGKVDIGFLMLLAGAGAILAHEARDAAILLFLFSLSGTLETFAINKMKKAISSLIKLTPETAIRISDGQEEEVAISELNIGDIIKIVPYQRVPIDSIITTGSSSIDESIITGESRPVSKHTDDILYGGSSNLEGLLNAKVNALPGDTHLERIIKLVEDAQKKKASTEKVSDWFGEKYTYFVLACFITSLSVRYFFYHQGWDTSLYSSLTLLVALSPCALVISTPAATLCALSNAARNGILVRGSSFFEKIIKINFIAFDKTGTLTIGKPGIQQIYISEKNSVEQYNANANLPKSLHGYLQIIAAAEYDSNHPIARCIIEYVKNINLTIPKVEEHQTLPGLGVSSLVNGKRVLIGRNKLFEKYNIPIPDNILSSAEKISRSGDSIIFVLIDETWLLLSFIDTIRNNSAEVVDELTTQFNIETSVLSGDNENTVKKVAETLKIKNIFAKLLPEDKNKIIEDLINSGKNVMMVGDGINDAPSLAKANVGVAMGGLGSDVTLNAADVVLVNDNLSKLVYLFKLSKKSQFIIYTNIAAAVGAIVLLTMTSLFIALPLPLAVIGHEGSTLLVIGNSLRLLNKIS